MTDFSSTRRHQRIALRIPVDVSTIDPETDPRTGRPYFRDCQELCGNLSTGGMFIATPEPPSPGRRLLLRIHAPGGGRIETLARVAWRTPGLDTGAPEGGVGIEFLAASAETRAALERIVNGSPATSRESRG
jgi:Tfp pilus assembly protein PilZ